MSFAAVGVPLVLCWVSAVAGVPSYVGVPADASKLSAECVLQLVLTLMMPISK